MGIVAKSLRKRCLQLADEEKMDALWPSWEWWAEAITEKEEKTEIHEPKRDIVRLVQGRDGCSHCGT